MFEELSLAARRGEAQPGSSSPRQGIILDDGASDAKGFGSHRGCCQDTMYWPYSHGEGSDRSSGVRR